MFMKDRYRLRVNDWNGSGFDRRVVWYGPEEPDRETVAQFLPGRQQEVRSPFNQAMHDYLHLQKRRRIGWQTIETIHLFDTEER